MKGQSVLIVDCFSSHGRTFISSLLRKDTMLQTVSNLSGNIARNIEIGSEEPVVGWGHLVQTNHKQIIIMTNRPRPLEQSLQI